MKKLRNRLVGVIAFLIFRMLWLTWRIQIIESGAMKQARRDGTLRVYGHWHGDELGLVYLLGMYQSVAIVSSSDDGEIMNTVATLMGSKTARGSSTRGGVSALKATLRAAKNGFNPAIAVDGPKGPFHQVKPGVFEISKVIGAPIFPLAAAADRTWVFSKSWNKTWLAKPFARMVVVWGDPLPKVDRDSDPHSPELSQSLAAAIDAASQRAKDLVGHSPNC